MRDSSANSVLLSELRGDIQIHDISLTKAARLAVATSDRSWVDNYYEVESKLTASISDALKLARSDQSEILGEAVSESILLLVALEARAFELLTAGRPDAAAEMLYSNEYRERKNRYRESLNALLNLLQRESASNVEQQRSKVSAFLMTMMVAVLFLGLMWLRLWHRIKRWNASFKNEQQRREAAESSLQLLNNQLERKVEDRTAALRESQERLLRLANYDELTGLPNRRRTLKELETRLNVLDPGKQLRVCILDIQGFRRINETLGHAIGSSLLTQVAERLEALLREYETVGRVGGDEFLCFGEDDESDELKLEDRLMAAFDESFVIGDEQECLQLVPRIGVAFGPEHGVSADVLMQNADHAMFQSAHQQDGRVFFFSNEIEEQRARRHDIEEGLKQALANEEFYLHYQPKIELASNEIVGCEALIRWQHPTMGFIPPDQFIPVAEENGTILAIGAWVMEEATRQAALWREGHGVELEMAVNVAAQQLGNVNFLPELQSVLERNRLAPAMLQLEVTESSLLDDNNQTLDLLTAIDRFGCKLALDDFGTGYSSLSYLKKYPFDYVKIDRSFVMGMLENHQDSAVIRAIIALSNSLGMSVIAEGVETATHSEALRHLGCNHVQGYFYSRPLPADELVEFYQSWQIDQAA